MLSFLEASADYPKESDGTINQSGKLNFFSFKYSTEHFYFVYTFMNCK